LVFNLFSDIIRLLALLRLCSLIHIVSTGGSKGGTRTDGCTMWITLRRGPPGKGPTLCHQGTNTLDAFVFFYSVNTNVVLALLDCAQA